MTLVPEPDTLPNPNPDNDLSIHAVIMKYQLDYTDHFGPKYAYGVCNASHRTGDNEIKVIARVKKVHQSTKGETVSFSVDMDKFNIWRNNIKLYAFISAK